MGMRDRMKTMQQLQQGGFESRRHAWPNQSRHRQAAHARRTSAN